MKFYFGVSQIPHKLQMKYYFSLAQKFNNDVKSHNPMQKDQNRIFLIRFRTDVNMRFKQIINSRE